MKRLVQVVAAFLVFAVVGISFLRAVQLENMLPLNSDDVGYINFQHSALSNQEIDAGLAEIGTKTGLEILQLSGTVGTLKVEIISRGSNQPAKTESLAWFRPGKQGTLSPASAHPNSARSGVYALKGTPASQAQLRSWLDQQGAIHTWEHFSTWQTYFLPLAYQGVIFILIVTSLLVVATIFAWFVTRAHSRIIRLSTGSTRSRIVFTDTLELLLLFTKPVFITAGILLGSIAIWKGKLVLELLGPVLLIFFAITIGLFLSVTLISYLVFPKIADWVNRRPLIAGYSWVSTLLCAIVLGLPLAFLPFLQYTLANTRDNEAAARQALQLPQYYSLSFGGIVDEERDYDPHIGSFAKLAKALERQGQMAFFRQTPVIAEENPELAQAGYRNIVSLNQKAFQDLQKISGGCQFQALSLADHPEVKTEAHALSLVEESPSSPIRYYECRNQSFPIAVRGQGVFSVPTRL